MVRAASEKPLTVSEINLLVKGNLEELYPSVWVEGEISNFKHHTSGHMYFTLKDERCQLRCVMFRGANSRLAFTPADGMSVYARGGITIYEKSDSSATRDMELSGGTSGPDADVAGPGYAHGINRGSRSLGPELNLAGVVIAAVLDIEDGPVVVILKASLV